MLVMKLSTGLLLLAFAISVNDKAIDALGGLSASTANELRALFNSLSGHQNLPVIVLRVLLVVSLIFLWPWIYNQAARRFGGLKLELTAARFIHAVERVDVVQAIKTGSMISFINAVFLLEHLSVLIVVQIGLNSLFYNLIVRAWGGLELNLQETPREDHALPAAGTFELLRIRPASAFRAGLALVLPELALVLLVIPAESRFAVRSMIFAVIYVAIKSIGWPLLALLYNWLARRNGGVSLEFKGELPALAPERAAPAQ